MENTHTSVPTSVAPQILSGSPGSSVCLFCSVEVKTENLDKHYRTKMCKMIRNKSLDPDMKRIVDHFLERIMTLEKDSRAPTEVTQVPSDDSLNLIEQLLGEKKELVEKIEKLTLELEKYKSIKEGELHTYVDKKVEPLIDEIRRLKKDRERIEKIIKRPLKLDPEVMKVIDSVSQVQK